MRKIVFNKDENKTTPVKLIQEDGSEIFYPEEYFKLLNKGEKVIYVIENDNTKDKLLIIERVFKNENSVWTILGKFEDID